MSLVNFVTPYHISTKREYHHRASDDKDTLSNIAKKFDEAYWDGPRKYGYGGYHNDGRWHVFADKLIKKYGLGEDKSVFEIGCGKGFLISALRKKTKSQRIFGLDISEYAIGCMSKDEQEKVVCCDVAQFEWQNKKFDLILAINTLHNLPLPSLWKTLEMIASCSSHQYICVESYRTEREKWNLMRWQLTCESYFSPKEWLWLFEKTGYQGDYEFIYFE